MVVKTTGKIKRKFMKVKRMYSSEEGTVLLSIVFCEPASDARDFLWYVLKFEILFKREKKLKS